MGMDRILPTTTYKKTVRPNSGDHFAKSAGEWRLASHIHFCFALVFVFLAAGPPATSSFETVETSFKVVL